MLVKRSSKNQIAIPKAVLQRAGLGPKDVYFDVECKNGHIVLTPVEIEEKVPAEAYEKLLKRASKVEKGDTLLSQEEAEGFLGKLAKS